MTDSVTAFRRSAKKKSYTHYPYISVIIKVGTRKRTDMRYYILLLYINYRRAPRGGRQSADTGDWVGNTALSDQRLGAIDRSTESV